MELNTAVNLIERGVPTGENQRWADLGAGSGLFTRALSQLIPGGSSITAIDKKPGKIVVANGIHLETKAGDFTTMDLVSCDGILMANSLHYVKDQTAFLKKLLTSTKRIILVEYNTDTSNAWVPYPLSFGKLKSLGFNATKIGEAPSQYHKEGIYAALILL